MSFFVPYVDVPPRAEGKYVTLVTPWGSIKLNKGFMEQLAWSVAVIVLTVMLWRCSARLNATLKKKTATKETHEEEEDDEDKEEEEKKEEEQEERVKSVPDEQMVKKGENYYYYSHQNQETIDGKTTVSSYGWSDSKKTISIYLTDNVVTNMKDDQLEVRWTNMSLSMDLLKTSSGDRAKSLVISTLFQEITGVTWEANRETLTIVLTKAQEIPWTSLNGAARKMEDHIEYDDAFYE